MKKEANFGVKVLVIEDENLTRVSLVKILEREGLYVMSTSSGDEGLKIFKKSDFDCVITDLNIPGIAGVKLLKELKKIKPSCKVIVMTSYHDNTIKKKLEKEGILAFFRKPIMREEMKELIRKIKETQSKNGHA